MAVTLPRIGRFISSIFAPAAAIFGFSCLLTFIFVLYQPHPGPGAIQRLGWQSWDIVSDTRRPSTQSPPVDTEEHPGGSGAIDVPPGSGGGSGGTDWWNVTAPPDSTFDPATLPLDAWDPLLPHDTGISEIEISQCYIDPWLMPSVAGDVCSPRTSKEQDARRGKWVQVDRNLNYQGYSYLNVYYRRTRRLDVPMVTEIRILPDKETPSPFGPAWHKVSRPVSPRGEKLYLWYKAEKTISEMTAEEKQNQLITELDITYGDDVPWFGFEKLERPVAPREEDKKLESIWLTIRHGVKRPPKAQPLHFSHDGKFKIMQVADLHFSVNQGVCKDTVINPCTASDNMTLSLLADVLDKEKPDLVVFTGDQLNGQGTSWDAKSVLAKFAKTVTERQIPWAAVFGNHDDEDGDTRTEQIKYMQGLPYSLVQSGPKDIHGAGNYLLKVYSADPSKTHLFTLYFLDSGSYAKGTWDFFGMFHATEMDHLRQDQIDWFLEESSRISPVVRPFTPDTGKDFGDAWKRQDSQLASGTKLAKPNAMMFFHMPLQEAYSKPDVDTRSGAFLDLGLKDMEPRGSAKGNDGFFHKAVLKAMESDHAGTDTSREVKVIANGHCHITENCRRVKGVWNCFGGGGSYSGYGRVGFDRRFRLFEIADYGETIRTWKHTEHAEMHNFQTLSGKGSPPPYVEP